MADLENRSVLTEFGSRPTMSESDQASLFSAAARRRQLTLLFSDLSDSVTIAGNVEPEQDLEVLGHLRRCAHAIIPKHDGTIVDFRGDGFLAMFGYPSASEGDWRSAIDAALELHDVIARVKLPLPPMVSPVLNMHSGIHSGLVLVIEGDVAGGGFALVGEPPGIAARLSDAASRNEILVSATTLGTEHHLLTIGERRMLTLQGKASATAAYLVLGRASIATRFEARVEHGLTPFVGRVSELAMLDDAFTKASRGRIQAVSVVGSAGIGKTRLVEEFLRTVAGRSADVYRGFCGDHRSAEPLQPFRQILRSLSEALPFSEVVRAVRTVVSDRAAARPLVIFIDDWHWADDASRQVLAAVRELTDRPILILTTSRTTDDDTSLSGWDKRIVLSPLDETDTVQTIQTLRAIADPFMIRRVQEMSGGNPLFIEELCHAAAITITDTAGDRESQGPPWLGTLIESRVARLPRRAR